MSYCRRAIVVLVALMLSLIARAEPVVLPNLTAAPIGEHIEYLQAAESLTLSGARAAFADGQFTRSETAVLNFGIGAGPVWLRLEVSNTGQAARLQRLAVHTSWLDSVEAAFIQDGEVQARYAVGDRQPFGARVVASRFFAFDHAFQPGLTTVYLRVATPDPQVLPIYLSSLDQAYQRQSLESYWYGALYGFLFALLAYNFMLYVSLKNRRYLYYSVYLVAFLVMNLAYTGHGYHWLWPDAPTWQRWSNPVLMVAFAISGLLFAIRFLNTWHYFPRLHIGVLVVCAGFALLEGLAITVGNHAAALLVAFVFIFIFSFGMIFIGALSLHAGNRSARYFLVASITHSVASSITAMAVWGFIPFSLLAYHAVEIGMMIDAALLAIALADQYRRIQTAKINAERLARVDPLTRLNNRRAFQELARPLWSTGLRRQKDMAIILMDIDRFKIINDTCGHVYGDEVLVQVAETLQQNARDSDILARWGGEEFILFLPETTLEESEVIAERLRDSISQLILTDDCKLKSLTASFGIAHTDHQPKEIEELISMADKNLYLAKSMGRDRVCAGHLG